MPNVITKSASNTINSLSLSLSLSNPMAAAAEHFLSGNDKAAAAAAEHFLSGNDKAAASFFRFPMNAKQELTQNDEIEICGKIKHNVEKIEFDVVINMPVLVSLLQAVVSAYLARPDPLKMALDCSPFLALALLFICAKTTYDKFGAQKETKPPLFRSIEPKMKSPEAKQRALTVLALIMMSIYVVYHAIHLPKTSWHMKVWFAILWINVDIMFIISEMYGSAIDIKGKRRMAAAASVGLTIQCWYLMVTFLSSLKWILVGSALTFGTLIPFLLRFALNLRLLYHTLNLDQIPSHQISMPSYDFVYDVPV